MNTTQKVGLIEIQNRKVRFARTKGKTLFYNVGGRIEQSETHEETLIRECKEELNVRILPESCVFLFEVTDERLDKPGELIQIFCYAAQYEGKAKASSEIEELGWFSSSDAKRTTPAGQQILAKLNGLGLID